MKEVQHSSTSLVLRVGILGTAAIARRSILPALLSLPDHYRVVGIASRSMDAASAFVNELENAPSHGTGPSQIKPHGSYASLLEDPSVDAVYVPLPNGLHYEWVSRALRAGKHVLCEKSLGCTLQETEDMVALAEANDLALVENFQFRFHHQLQVLREWTGLGGHVASGGTDSSKEGSAEVAKSKQGDGLESVSVHEQDETSKNVIGDLRAVRCSFGFPPFPDRDNIRYQKELGGGALLDAGAYMMKIAALLMGDAIQVEAASLVKDEEYGVDVHGGGCLVDPGTGVTAHIAFGFDHYYQCGVEVWGSKGRVRTNRLFTAKANVQPVFEIETAEGGREERVLQADDHFVNMLRHFHSVCVSHQPEKRAEENRQNRLQARLLEDFRAMAERIEGA